MREREDDFERLPCGCAFTSHDEAFIYLPCEPDCPFFVYVVNETRRQGKLVRKMEFEDEEEGGVA